MNENNIQHINTTEAKTILRVTPQTLRNWSKSGKIDTIRTPSGQRLYNKQQIYDLAGIPLDTTKKQKIVYCRVSSKKQMDDLGRQVDFLKSKYPDHIVVTDIGSGINWKRKGLKTILEQSLSGNVEEIVVAHRDRLCRFAFELLEFIFTTTNTKLVVLEHDSNQSTEQELADDLLSIVHIYSCRKMGQRRYKNKTNKDVSKPESKETTTTMDGNH